MTYRFNKTISRFPFFLALALGAAACSNTKGYPGPERPESELARLFFYAQKPLEISEMQIDGQNKGIFDLGVSVIPGRHLASASFELKEDQGCDYYSCSAKTYRGHCETDMEVAAGKSYAIRLTGVVDRAFIRVEEEETKAIAGSGTCTTTKSDIEYKPNGKR